MAPARAPFDLASGHFSAPATDGPVPFNDMGPEGEDLWIDVIRKMDSVYADLVTSQVALEEQNTALEQARGFWARCWAR
jgi:two-component system sensor histidine kinase HupT/HoxJ